MKLPGSNLIDAGSLSASRFFAVNPIWSAYSGFMPGGHRAALVIDMSPENLGHVITVYDEALDVRQILGMEF